MSINPDKTRGRYMNTYVSLETWKKLSALAIIEDKTAAAFCSELLEKFANELQWPENKKTRK